MRTESAETIHRHRGKRTFFQRMRGYFFTGLVALVPVALTGYIIWQLFWAIDGILRGVANKFLIQNLGFGIGERQIPGVGFITLILFIILTGVLARNYFGRRLLLSGEKVLARIPFINKIYSAIQQIIQAIFSNKREVFKHAVLIEYPRRGIYSIGFYTQDTKGEVQERVSDDVVSVFLPTTPNPTSGFLLFVPKKEVIPLSMSIEDALKLVISGGAIVAGSSAQRGSTTTAPLRETETANTTQG
jgi:uncharacterized membrane protein